MRSVPLQERVLCRLDLRSLGGIIRVGGEIGGIAGALHDGPEGRADLLGQQGGEVDAVQVAVVLYVAHACVGKRVPFLRFP